MELRGVVGPADGNKPRKILVQAAGGAVSYDDSDEAALDEKLD
jgi:DNA segregation ATPase FtsK/SpoIIIE-like protein